MRYSILKYLFIFCLSIALYACNMESNDILVPAKQLIERQIGIRANEITCQVIEPVNGKETFEIEARDGVLVLKGSSTVAICYAFHTYLKEACHAMKTWSGEHIELPEIWPDYIAKKQTTPYSYRYFLNVCTYGYTTPYW